VEPIEQNLLKDEEILWSYKTHKNLLETPLKHLLYGGIVFIIGFPFILVLTIVLNLISILISFGIFFTFGILLWTLGEYRDYRLLFKNLNQSKGKLRNYEEALYLTNKRWIQKSYSIFKVNIKMFPTYAKNQDFLFIKYNDIKSLLTVLLPEKSQIFIGIVGLYKKRLDVFDYLGFYIPKIEYESFINTLNQYLALKVEETFKENITRYVIK